MTVTEVLQLMESLLYKQGKEFEDLHREIITGLLEYKSYREIAEGINYDPEYVGNISRELYDIVSNELKKLGQEGDVKKSNFTTSIEKLVNSANHSFLHKLQIIKNNYINLCSNNTQNHYQDNNNQEFINRVNTFYHDLTLAPQIIKFYNRETELKTLADWIFNQNIRLISILGLSGIGKTALVKKFVDLNLEQFEVIIWRSLKYPQPLDLLVNDFLHIFQEEPQNTIQAKLQQLFTILNEKKCLIILDDVQNIFERGELAGKYNIPYQDYQNFFTMLTATQHQSNIILISQEKCAEMQCLDQQLYPIKCLELLGLDDISILENTNLNNQDVWLKLIQLYEGNLIYLKEVVSLIQDIYDGELADFLTENSLIITQNMQSYFNDLFNRLSPIEQQIILELSKSDQLISREDLKKNLPLSSVYFVKGLQSLQQRYIVTKIKADKILFKLSPVFREYVINSCEN